MTDQELDALMAEALATSDQLTTSLNATKYIRDLLDALAALRAENARLREVAMDSTASLVAAVSLLERGGKKAAASNKMFDTMLSDYRKSIARARQALGNHHDAQG